MLKKNPKLTTDGIGIVREGNRIYIAGNQDESHYYAVAELLRRRGCRWYLPTEFGQCIPEEATLTVGDIDDTGKTEFQLRNMMRPDRSGMPNCGHAPGGYTGDAPGSKGTFNFPFTASETA